MNSIVISPTKVEPAVRPIEIVERKGVGHPDTLSDALGEHLSCTYSNYTRTRFGAILRHQFDKVALMCGRSKVSFGDGEMLEPIRVLINGRASACLGDENIPVRELLIEATREFFAARFPMLDFNRDFRIGWTENVGCAGIHVKIVRLVTVHSSGVAPLMICPNDDRVSRDGHGIAERVIGPCVARFNVYLP